MGISIRAMLEAGVLLLSFVFKLSVFHAVLRWLGRGASHLRLSRSLMVSLVIVMIGVYGIPRLMVFLPAGLQPFILFVTALVMFPIAIPLTQTVCDIEWAKATLASLVLIVTSGTMDYLVPKFADRFLPEGTSLTDLQKKTDATMEALRANATNSVKTDTVGTLRTGLDALATLTTKGEQEAMREDFARGLAFYAERKQLMDQMTEAELAEYHAEMARFLAEQGLMANAYSPARLPAISSNDVVLLSAALKDLRTLYAATGVVAEVKIRTIAESLQTIATNLTSVSMTTNDMARFQRITELFAQDELDAAMAQAKADLQAAAGDDAMALALMMAMAEPGPSGTVHKVFNTLSGPQSRIAHLSARGRKTGKSPHRVTGNERVSVPCAFGELRIPVTVTNVDHWIRAAQGFQVKGAAKLGTRSAVLLAKGGLLAAGDIWHSTYNSVKYTFRIEDVKAGRIILAVLANTNGLPRDTTDQETGTNDTVLITPIRSP